MSTALTRDDVRLIEAIEAEVLAQMHTVTTPATRDALGLGFERVGTAALGWASESDTLTYNRAFNLGLSEPVTETELDRIVERFRRVGSKRFYVQLAPGAQPDTLPGWLEARGLVLHNRWAKLWRNAAPPPPATSDLRVARIDRAHAAAFGEIIAEAFGNDEPMRDWFAATVELSDWRHYAAFDGDEPVAAACMVVRGQVANLAFAGTRASHRGRGAQSALITRRIADAIELGCQIMVVETAEDTEAKPSPSFRNVRRFGFELAYLRPNYLGTAAG